MNPSRDITSGEPINGYATPADEGEERLLSLLVAYDGQLADGIAAPTAEDVASTLPAELSERLKRACEVLTVLERARRAGTFRGIGADGSDDSHNGPALETLGRFEIISELGRGAFGIVFLALDPLLRRRVALKIPRPEALLTPDLRRRFMREAQAAASLTHPNLVPVFETGEVGPICYIAAAYCAGPTMAAWLREQAGPVSPKVAALLIAQLADGVAYAHSQGILHRDIKPTNVLLEPRTGAVAGAPAPADSLGFTPKLTDFGLAKIEELTSDVTRTGAVLGTPAYMAPEQATGRLNEIGPATDVYSLGTILYELLTRRPPFGGQCDREILHRALTDEPVALRKLRRDVSADLEAICLKCLEKKPAARYTSAAALADDLRRYLADEPTLARPAKPIERFIKWSRRRPALAGLLGVAMAATAVIVTMTAVYVARLREANEVAEVSRLSAETSRLAAEANAEKSARHEQAAIEALYGSHMKLAYQAIDQGEIETATELLERYQPGSELAGLRGFEWYHLKRRLHSERLSLVGHKGEVYAVTFSPDGRQVISGGEDGTIRVWDAESGQQLHTITAHSSCVNVVVFSPSGDILASASCDRTIKLWDAHTFALRDTLEGHLDEIHSLAFCPADPNLLAAGGHESVASIWNLAAYKVVHTFDGGGCVNGLAWLADGKTLLVAGGLLVNKDGHAYAWQPENGHVEKYPWRTLSVATSPSGDICWGADSIIRGVVTGSSQPLMLPGHSGRIEAVKFSPSGNRFATAGSDRTIRLWDSAKNVCLEVFAGHLARVQALAFSPRDSTLASASFDGSIKLWKDEPADRSVWEFASCWASDCETPAEISADFCYVAVLGKPNEVHVYRLDDGSRVGILPLATVLRGLQFLPNRPVLFGAAVDSARGLDEWNVEKWQLVKSHSRPARWSYAIGRWEPYLVIDYPGGTTELLHTATGQTWRSLERSRDGASDIAISPDGASLAIGRSHYGGDDWIVEAPDGRPPRRLTGSHDRLVAISNGGALLARMVSRISIGIIDAGSGRTLATLGHANDLGPVAFSPDGRTLATCSGDRTVHLWHVASGQELARLAKRPGRFQCVQFSSDGRRLAVISRSEGKHEETDLTYSNGEHIPSVDWTSTFVTTWTGIGGD